MLYGFAVSVLEVHVVDTPWKLWLELRTMMMESLKTVGLNTNIDVYCTIKILMLVFNKIGRAHV